MSDLQIIDLAETPITRYVYEKKHLKLIGELTSNSLSYLNSYCEHIHILDMSDVTNETLPEGALSLDEDFQSYVDEEDEDYVPSNPNQLRKVIFPKNMKIVPLEVLLNAEHLEEVVLPYGITVIESSAFSGCYRLSKINLPPNIECIESSAFYNTGYLSLTFPPKITSIGSSCFRYSRITDAIFTGNNNSSLEIGENAFSLCYYLKNITLPNNLKKIDYYTFCDCYSLKQIFIPQSVESIEGEAFSRCSSLVNVYIGNKEIKLKNNIFYIDDEIEINPELNIYISCLPQCNKCKLYYNNKEKHICLESNAENLEEKPEDLEEQISSITEEEAETYLDGEDNNNNNNLLTRDNKLFVDKEKNRICINYSKKQKYNLSEKFLQVEKVANKIKKCKKVKISGSLPYDEASYYKKTLKPLVKELDLSDLALEAIDKNLFSNSAKNNLRKIVLPSRFPSKLCFEKFFFNNKKIEEIVLPNTIKEIPNRAFANCTNLKKINLDNIEKIGDYAFTNCHNLHLSNFPPNVISLGKNPFSGCIFDTLVFGENCKLTNITEYSFENASINKIIFNNEIKNIEKNSLPSNKISEIHFKHLIPHITHGLFENFSCLQYITGKFRDKVLRYNAFKNCLLLRSINLDGIEIIEKNAFTGCNKLKRVNLGERMQYIGDNAFSETTRLWELHFPKTMKIIGANCFYESSLQNITFDPEVRLEKINKKAFCYAEIKHIEIPYIKYIKEEAFYSCSQLDDVIIKDGLISIGQDAFKNSYVKTVSLPKTLKLIDNGVFGNCYELYSITIPSCEFIRDRVFNYSKLTEIKLPKNLKYIGNYSFSNLKFKILNIPENSEINNNTFYNFTVNYLSINSNDPLKIGNIITQTNFNVNTVICNDIESFDSCFKLAKKKITVKYLISNGIPKNPELNEIKNYAKYNKGTYNASSSDLKFIINCMGKNIKPINMKPMPPTLKIFFDRIISFTFAYFY